MSFQYSRKPDLFGTEEKSETQPSSIGTSQLVHEAFTGELPKEQVLSYLTDPVADSEGRDLHKEFSNETISLDSSKTSLLSFPNIKPTTQEARSVSLQKWEGVVLEVMQETFLARLVDLTNQNVEEDAEFDLEEISKGDRDFVKPGAIFYWSIGYLDSRSGQRTRASVIRFRRLPAWSKQEIEAANREADLIGDELEWK
jgi:hypothetical protein